MAAGFPSGCSDPNCPSCYRGYRQHSFQTGDYVEATCSRGNPYSTTCEGWRGMITRTTSYGIWVKGEGDPQEYDVQPQYFRLISRRGRQEDYYYETKMMTLDQVYRQYPGSAELLTKKGKKVNKLNVMQKLILSKEDQTLVKAGYINGDLELTEMGRKALNSVLFAANKPALVALATEQLAEEKEESK